MVSLSHTRYEEIKQVVVDMFVKYDISCVPVNSFELAIKMGIKVIPYKEVCLMTSHDMRENALFMRNEFECVGKWQIPLIKKQEIDTNNLLLVAYSDTRANDNMENIKRGVHFFIDDYRFKGIYNNPDKSLEKLSQYAFLLTPDYSLYADMNLWRQIESVAHSRWIGAYWQSKGLKVIPTLSWSDARSYSFCFDGVEQNSIVAIGMIGCKRNKTAFCVAIIQCSKSFRHL